MREIATYQTAQALPAAEAAEELQRFRETAAKNSRPSLLGHMLKFRKGKWIAGEEKQEIAPGTRFVAVMGEVRHGWLKWNLDKTATHVVGKIAEGYEPPSRDKLDCTDESAWPIGLSGKQEDPWRRTLYLPLVSLDNERLLTFATTTLTGLSATWKFIDKYSWVGRKYPGQYPIVEIQNAGYEDKRYGWVDTPRFEIVGWSGRPDLALLTGGDAGGSDEDGAEVIDPAPPRDSFEDEVPF